MTALTALQRAILADLAEDLATSRPTAAEALQAALAACDARMMWETTGPFRTGRKLGRTIYNDDDILIGVMDTPELGAMVAAALNRSPAASGPSRAQVWRGPTHALDKGAEGWSGINRAVPVPIGTEIIIMKAQR